MTEHDLQTLCCNTAQELNSQFAHNLPTQLRIYADSHGGLANPEDLVRFALGQSQKYTEQYLCQVLKAVLEL